MTLLQFYVMPELQGRGIGTLVLKRLMGDAKRRGKLMALSVPKGSPAIRLFLRHGFHPTHADTYEIYMRQAVKLPLRGMGPSMGMRRG